MEKYYFGSKYNYQEVLAETLEEAKIEFSLMCEEVAKYSLDTHHSLCRGNLETPYGFNSNGTINEDYDIHEFWQMIPIRNKYTNNGIIGYITTTELQLNQQQVQNQIPHKPNTKSIENTNVSNSIQKMSLSLRQNSLSLLNSKKELAYKQREMSEQVNSQEYELSKLKEETEQLNKKIDILKIYQGLGNDIQQIHKGETSNNTKIDIFQSIRYMKEEIEMLSDFEDFDFRDMEAFDKWLAENYKILMPSECSIQVFKVSRNKIEYGESLNIFQENSFNKENSKKWIIIRNGDNVFRLFNSYNINENFFNSENMTMEYFHNSKNELIRQIEAPQFTEKQIEEKSHWANHDTDINSNQFVIKSDEELNDLYSIGIDIYNKEVERRREFILKYNLDNDKYNLSIDHWRWGVDLIDFKKECLSKWRIIYKYSLIKSAYEDKRFKDMLIANMDVLVSNYRSNMCYSDLEFIIETIQIDSQEELEEYKLKGYQIGLKNYQSSDYRNIESGETTLVDICLFDKDYIIQKATESFEENEKKFINEKALENFHSLAIIQNILDKKYIFPNHNGIDLIYGQGLEFINTVYDNENLLVDKSEEEFDKWIDNTLKNRDIYKKGDKVIILMDYTLSVNYSYGTSEKVYKEIINNKYNFCEGTIISISKKDNTIKVRGGMDIYTRSNYDKKINYGDEKFTTQIFDIGDWTKANIGNTYNSYSSKHIVMPILDKEIYKRWLHKRLFREKYANSWGQMFKRTISLY